MKKSVVVGIMVGGIVCVVVGVIAVTRLVFRVVSDGLEVDF